MIDNVTGSFAVALLGAALLYALRILEQTIQALTKVEPVNSHGKNYDFIIPMSELLKKQPQGLNPVPNADSVPVAASGQYL